MMSLADMNTMHDFENMSASDHEEVSVRFLVKFRDVYEDRIASGEIKATDIVGEQSVMVEDLLFAYFDFRRNTVPIPVPSPEFTCQQLIDFINDDVLLYISDEKPEMLEYEPRSGRYFILFDDEDD
tara:strand:+ start:1285 stop:1662 length:378 start_codon:yes stop_codon:yes gene_type:complete